MDNQLSYMTTDDLKVMLQSQLALGSHNQSDADAQWVRDIADEIARRELEPAPAKA